MAENDDKPKIPRSIAIFKQEETINNFKAILGDKTNWFLISMMAIVSNSSYLKDADPKSIYLAAMTAATLDLPINPNLWFAYIIPYSNKGKQEAQFQMWYKGFIQLAWRSGQFKTIDAKEVYEWQVVEDDSFAWYHFDWKNKGSKIIGYAAYFQFINWGEKTSYMTVEEVQAHAQKFSKNYTSSNSVWKTNFDAMAKKTVLKLLLQTYGALSTEMQKAVIADQWIIGDDNLDHITYPDNPQWMETENNINQERLDDWEDQLKECKTLDDIKALKRQNKPTDPVILSLFEKYEATFVQS